jgi:hypothetical protein
MKSNGKTTSDKPTAKAEEKKPVTRLNKRPQGRFGRFFSARNESLLAKDGERAWTKEIMLAV